MWEKIYVLLLGSGSQVSEYKPYSAAAIDSQVLLGLCKPAKRKSPDQNFEKRHWKVLRSRLYEMSLSANNAVERRSGNPFGEVEIRRIKSGRIIYPHHRWPIIRINKTVNNLPEVMECQIGEFISSLRFARESWKKCRPAESKHRTEILRVTPQVQYFI